MDLRALLDRILPEFGFELVELEFVNRGRLIRIFIDKPGGVDVDDCARVSNHLTRVFAVEGVDYGRLEVSSPGLDRVLRKPGDFDRFAGERVHLKLRAPVAGRKNFTGILRGLKGGILNIEVDGELMSLPFPDLERARLVPNV